MGDRVKSEIQKPVKNPLLSGAGIGFPFESFPGSSLLVPVVKESPQVLPEDVGEVDTFIGQETPATETIKSEIETPATQQKYTGLFSSFFGPSQPQEQPLNQQSKVQDNHSVSSTPRSYSPFVHVPSVLSYSPALFVPEEKPEELQVKLLTVSAVQNLPTLVPSPVADSPVPSIKQPESSSLTNPPPPPSSNFEPLQGNLYRQTARKPKLTFSQPHPHHFVPVTLPQELHVSELPCTTDTPVETAESTSSSNDSILADLQSRFGAHNVIADVSDVGDNQSISDKEGNGSFFTSKSAQIEAFPATSQSSFDSSVHHRSNQSEANYLFQESFGIIGQPLQHPDDLSAESEKRTSYDVPFQGFGQLIHSKTSYFREKYQQEKESQPSELDTSQLNKLFPSGAKKFYDQSSPPLEDNTFAEKTYYEQPNSIRQLHDAEVEKPSDQVRPGLDFTPTAVQSATYPLLTSEALKDVTPSDLLGKRLGHSPLNTGSEFFPTSSAQTFLPNISEQNQPTVRSIAANQGGAIPPPAGGVAKYRLGSQRRPVYAPVPGLSSGVPSEPVGLQFHSSPSPANLFTPNLPHSDVSPSTASLFSANSTPVPGSTPPTGVPPSVPLSNSASAPPTTANPSNFFNTNSVQSATPTSPTLFNPSSGPAPSTVSSVPFYNPIISSSSTPPDYFNQHTDSVLSSIPSATPTTLSNPVSAPSETTSSVHFFNPSNTATLPFSSSPATLPSTSTSIASFADPTPIPTSFSSSSPLNLPRAPTSNPYVLFFSPAGQHVSTSSNQSEKPLTDTVSQPSPPNFYSTSSVVDSSTNNPPVHQAASFFSPIPASSLTTTPVSHFSPSPPFQAGPPSSAAPTLLNQTVLPAMSSSSEDPGQLNTVDLSTPSPPRRSPSPSVVPQRLLNLGQSGVIYRPPYHHWFWNNDTDDKESWQPFSMTDSLELEQAFNSGSLTMDTMVATDGGRYDVAVVARRREAVYWQERPRDVRRCSWFQHNTMESRFRPYDENTAFLLEEEYKAAVMSATWNRRVQLNDGEYVVLYGPSSMAHFQATVLAPDAWEATTDPGTQGQPRPRIVKRGVEDFDIEDGESPVVDHLLFVVHGIGSICDLKFRTIEQAVTDFRSLSLQLVKTHYRTTVERGEVNRIEILPVSWHHNLHGETGVDEKLQKITLKSIPKLRHFTNDTLLDILYYTSPVYCQNIQQQVGQELNKLYDLFLRRNPSFQGHVSVCGHSLGSLILFDMLCHQKRPKTEDPANGSEVEDDINNEKDRGLTRTASYVRGTAGTGQPCIAYPQLNFQPNSLFALGSPIGMFVTVRGIDSLGLEFRLPTCPGFFNIFHPFDPVAYRIEALINPDLADLRPVLIPHHKGRKRMHLELRETMARVGADLKQRLIDSVKVTWNTVYQLTMFGRSDETIQQEVDQAIASQMEARARTESASEDDSTATPAGVNVGVVNQGRRIDYVLQEAPLESFNEYVSAITSHVCYWDSEDTILFILKDIYSNMGVAAESAASIAAAAAEAQATAAQPGPPSPPSPSGFHPSRPLGPMGMDPTAPISENTSLPPPPTTGFFRK